eukprot:gene463-3797_t
MDDGVDVLFDIRNALHIGNYQTCIKEAQSFKATTDDIDEECKGLMYRALIAQEKYAVVKGDISSSSPSSLQAIKMLAEFFHNSHSRDPIVEKVRQMQKDGVSLQNSTVAITCATILFNYGDADESLRCLHNCETIEALALSIQILLHIHRLDLAKKTLKSMQTIDEDATLTQLAGAWIHLAVGGDKIKDAFYAFQELCEKFVSTPLLLNGKAAALMLQGQYLDAEEALNQAQDKDPNNPNTLVNLYVVSSQLGHAPEVAQRNLNQLKDCGPTHPFIQDLQKQEALFDTFCQQYSE